ncbi:hypothetical protein [Deinococcus yavapaiensis]|uniref:Uncharacterized protein n=1 Tax=Deinococcus yavapaiensis KR-236 TaxID=694435 RepID=A0A318S3U8_9DEIO|nr:hypothetical protein [Deinococcus yavapaiensis]PYE49445.1 hypothetical protein DES52_12339 [Deinococcus yavapaiensis KR-236]
MPTRELDVQVRRSVEAKLPELGERLLNGGNVDMEDLEIVSRVKGNGVINVEVRAKSSESRPHSTATATFELKPTISNGQVTYLGTNVEYETGGI